MEKILNTPIPFDFNGKEVMVSEYSLCDMSEMKQWIKGQKLALLKNIPVEERLILMRETLTQKLTDEEYLDAAQSYDGVAYLFWCMLKRNTKITLDEVRAGITKDNMPLVAEMMATVNNQEGSTTGKK